MSAQVSEADYTHMPWHARQRLNQRLRHERDAILAELASAQRRATKAAANKAAAHEMTLAAGLLAVMDPDPQAAAHRYAIWQATDQRKQAVA